MTNSKTQNVVKEILNQLGGNKFIAMTDANCYSEGNTLIAKFKGSKIANIMYVTLNNLDLYDVKICKFKGLEVNIVKEVNNIYADMLKQIFEKTTQLYISL